jgi:hypothetical protein
LFNIIIQGTTNSDGSQKTLEQYFEENTSQGFSIDVRATGIGTNGIYAGLNSPKTTPIRFNRMGKVNEESVSLSNYKISFTRIAEDIEGYELIIKDSSGEVIFKSKPVTNKNQVDLKTLENTIKGEDNTEKKYCKDYIDGETTFISRL